MTELWLVDNYHHWLINWVLKSSSLGLCLVLPLGIHCITHTHKHTHTHTNTCLMLNLKCVFGHSVSVILFSRGAPLPAIKSNYFGHKTVLFFNLASRQNFALFSFPCRHSFFQAQLLLFLLSHSLLSCQCFCVCFAFYLLHLFLRKRGLYSWVCPSLLALGRW